MAELGGTFCYQSGYHPTPERGVRRGLRQLPPEQIGLFGHEEFVRVAPTLGGVHAEEVARQRLHPGLDNLALLYTTSEKGNSSGIRFMMSLTDAMTWCESDISRGQLHGTQWIYCFTRVSTFLGVFREGDSPTIVIDGLEDNGQWDDRIRALGLTKIALDEFAQVLRPLGVEIVGVPIVMRFRERAA